MYEMQIETTVQQESSNHDENCFALSHVQEILERNPYKGWLKLVPLTWFGRSLPIALGCPIVASIAPIAGNILQSGKLFPSDSDKSHLRVS